ncbi:MAG: hypothetical protein CVU46_02495 [Chloroflexi bacterium HGW-Chloroflexi-8]|nr:MAG: hypothetical protein CVU46_02495 [Chloroflexi bacterium HGW-Chloroflexi-8]
MMKQRDDRWWNFYAVFFLLAAFMVTTFRIESTGWVKDLHILKWLTAIGFLLGLGFGYSYFSSLHTRIMVILYSIVILPWSFVVTTEDTLPWMERTLGITNRFGLTLGKFFNNTPLEDPILFMSFLALVVWVTAFWGGYALIRSGKPWIPLIISTITIFTTEFYYTQNKNLYSFVFVVFALMVLSITNFMKSTKKWTGSGTLVEFETQMNIGKSAFIVSLVLVFLAWNISGLVVAYQSGDFQKQQLVGIFENIRKQISRITAPLQGPLLIQQDFYGDTVGLGTGAILGNDLVFNVSVDKSRPQGTRYYWRARTYDTYEDGLWKSTITNEIPVNADVDSVSYDDNSRFKERIFTFNSNINLGLLYTPIYPTKINRNATAIAALHPQNNIDLSALTLDTPIYAGENYQVTAKITSPTIMEMKTAPNNYPKWVLETYLQLPNDFSSKIQELALDLTDAKTNNYDKVQAITLYLRSAIKYTETVPLPPKNVDPMEWFLFDLKQGFCNYYATAEVLMLRSIGIPARIVYGYAQGNNDSDEKSYTVVRKQSHAWPEVYFSGLGWVEFEPTSALPIITRMSGITLNPADDLSRDESDLELLDIPLSNPPLDGIENIDVPPSPENRFSLINLLPIVWVIGLIDLVLLYLIKRQRLGISMSPPVFLENFMVKRGWKIPAWLKKWSYYVKLDPAEKAFSSIPFSNYLLGDRTNLHLTPTELVKIFSGLLPLEKENAQEMLGEYQKILFSRHPGNLGLIQKNSRIILNSAIRKRLKILFSRKKEDV